MTDPMRPTDADAPGMDDATRVQVEAAAFRRLRAHLLEDRPDAQNIDMMNLAGFCRNCLSRWYGEAAEERGVTMTKDEARTAFYGMPFDDWRAKHQDEATEAQRAAFATSFAENVGRE